MGRSNSEEQQYRQKVKLVRNQAIDMFRVALAEHDAARTAALEYDYPELLATFKQLRRTVT